MNLDFIFEHIPILKQLPDLSSSCRVFGTYPGFETITGIHINVIFQAFPHLRNKKRFIDKVKYKKNRKSKRTVPYNLKIITSFRNQNIDIICSAGNCMFKMLENKSLIYSNLT